MQVRSLGQTLLEEGHEMRVPPIFDGVVCPPLETGQLCQERPLVAQTLLSLLGGFVQQSYYGQG